MKFSMTTMADYYQITKAIVRPIQINMVNFQSSFSYNTTRTFIRQFFKCFFSVFCITFSSAKTFDRTKIILLQFPVFYKKFLKTFRTYTFYKNFRLGLLIANKTTKNLLIGCNSKFLFALTTIFIDNRNLISTSTAQRTKTSLFLNCKKYFITKFANLFHGLLYNIKSLNINNKHINQEVLYGL